MNDVSKKSKKRKFIQDFKNEVLNDEEKAKEYFNSASYKNTLSSLMKSCCDSGAIRLIRSYDDTVAFTDGIVVTINLNNEISLSFDSPVYQDLSYKGLEGHEIGHILYSDFKLLDKFVDTFNKGKIFRKSKIKHKNLAKMQNALDDTSTNARTVVCTLAKDLNNLLEDIYIESRMKEEYPYSCFKKGIILNNSRMGGLSPTFDSMLNSSPEIIAIINFMIGYLKARITTFGDVDNNSRKAKIVDDITKCFPILDDYSFNYIPEKRAIGSVLILCELWEYVEKYITDKAQQNQQNNPNNSDNQNGQGDNSDQSGQGSQSSQNAQNGQNEQNSQIEKEIDDMLSTFGNTKMPQGNNSNQNNRNNQGNQNNQKSQESRNNSSISSSDIFNSNKKDMTELDMNQKGEAKEAEGTGRIEKEEYSPSVQDTEGFKAELDKYAESAFNAGENTSATNSLNIEKNNIRKNLPSIHRYTDYIISKPYGNDYKDTYERLLERYGILQNAKKMAKAIKRYLQDEEYSTTQRNLYSGNKLMRKNYYRLQTDKRIFEKTHTPIEHNSISVSILVDMSGSMSGARIRYAMLTAIQLYEFCNLLDIPITIMGHNEQYSNKVSLYSFVDSENRVKGDNYSIASMSAGGCNRDGASIEFCCQHLEKRKEDKKIFFIISDGQPSGTGYSGLEACKDCAEIAEKYRKKGFTFIATAIGNDKERIKAIYGSENFLDISDLSQMAGRLTKIIRKNFLN